MEHFDGACQGKATTIDFVLACAVIAVAIISAMSSLLLRAWGI
jgi:hypothetical protein